MKSGFQKRKDRDSRQRAAIAAKSRKMTEFFEEAACKNKESCSSATACEKLKSRMVEEAACKNKESCSSTTACEKTKIVEEVACKNKEKKVVVLLLLVKKLEHLKRLDKKFMKLRLRIAQY